MLQIAPLSRPSASELFAEFCHSCQDLQTRHSENIEITAMAGRDADVSTPNEEMGTSMHDGEESRRINEIIKAWKEKGTDVSVKNHSVPTIVAQGLERSQFASAKTPDNLPVTSSETLRPPKSDRAEIEKYNEKLSLAAKNGKLDDVRLLLAKGADIAAKEEYHGRTALHWAMEKGHRDVVALLLHRMDPDMIAAMDRQGTTVLHWAARQGHRDVVAQES